MRPIDAKPLDNNWREREQDAQYSRTLPVWANERWHRVWDFPDAIRHHYAHVSVTNPALIAYTADEGKGQRNIQTPIKPGRYLTKYFSDRLTPKQIAFYAAWQATGSPENCFMSETSYPMGFASTPDEIAEVYQGPIASCMDGQHFDADDSPVRVYGAGDLAIATLKDSNGFVRARCLVWPARKVAGRVYPSRNTTEECLAYDALLHRLRAADYQFASDGASFSGAKLLKIEGIDGYRMPYLDQDYGVDDHGDHFVMQRGGRCEIACQETNGYISESDPYATCENCDDEIEEADGAYSVVTRVRQGRPVCSSTWCQNCVDNGTFYCEGLSETVSDDVPSINIGGSLYSESWAERIGCFYSDYSEEYFFSDDTASVAMANGDTWTDEEFSENGFVCAITGENYSNDDAHADHPEVSKDVDEDALAAWIALTVVADPAQNELDLVA